MSDNTKIIVSMVITITETHELSLADDSRVFVAPDDDDLRYDTRVVLRCRERAA
jgi:hypothetical protein